MTQQEQDLLLKDLCMRLPYGAVFMGNKEWNRKPYQLTCDEVQYVMMSDDWDDVPYLRPMSSMTEEEIDEFTQFDVYADGEYVMPNYQTIDWLLSHHFDFRGLIEKGLAIEVNESNNPYK